MRHLRSGCRAPPYVPPSAVHPKRTISASYRQLHMQRPLNTAAKERASVLLIAVQVSLTPPHVPWRRSYGSVSRAKTDTPCTGVRQPTRAQSLRPQHCIHHILSQFQPSACTRCVAGCLGPTPARPRRAPAPPCTRRLTGRHPAARPSPRATMHRHPAPHTSLAARRRTALLERGTALRSCSCSHCS